MKKTNLFISLACALILVATMVAPVMAAGPVEQTVGASVTISEYINATVTVTGGTISFGTLIPGDTNKPETHQDGTGAISISVAKETNAVCEVGIKGSGDFSDGGTPPITFALSNAKWDKDNDVSGALQMTTTYAQIGLATVPGTAWSQDVWHWISIPDGQAAATSYTTNFLYKVAKTL